MAEALLALDEVRVEYRQRRGASFRACDQVSFDIHRGETLGLVGESGSGKTTIGRAILGLVPISSGRIRFDGRDITRLGSRERRALTSEIQVVFQDPFGSLNPALSIGSTLVEPLLAHESSLSRGQLRRRVAESLELVGLPARAAARYPEEFSGGQRQRIAIARALMVRPKLIVCDEAVSALDLTVQAQVLNLLGDLARDLGLSYLFISHDLGVVRHVASRVVVLYAGSVAEIGSMSTLSRQPAHPYTSALLAAAPIPDPAAQAHRRAAFEAQIRSNSTSDSAPGIGCSFAQRCPHAIERCLVERPRPLTTVGGSLAACHRADELTAVLSSSGRG